MPLLLGIPALLRYLIGLLPIFIGFISSFITKLVTKTGIISFSLVSLLAITIGVLLGYLSSILYNPLPNEYFILAESILPDSFTNCVSVVMATKITVFCFDLKDRFLEYANRIL
ncbi:DUF5455 family protein [Providencia rettgeri]|uniref:DUF5455 family protein n=1 Tax=Providencia TaxID=586 RepID=UPI000C7F6122|nr:MULTISPECIES: DUF5455 family protein [Providencia]AXH61464.1 Head virion protein G6P [Providencia huaxiensis]AXH61475.1 Head virion protein G6P [Providencia huaxiensis]MBJ9969414.1 DUF5455 family protein [Providencia rettgeri]MBS0914430.1 DUF5455 family protein [Providencia rettgeri]MCB6144536.1 DUF5455 family protein [Providencia rettgeri]